MKFGEKVKQLRKSLHLSQTDLAAKIGVSMRTVQSYELGQSYPKQREMYNRLAEALGCDTNYLLTEDAEFLTAAAASYGRRGARQARDLITEVSGLFAGGELAEEDKDEMMRAIQEAYWTAKKNNRKYAAGSEADAK